MSGALFALPGRLLELVPSERGSYAGANQTDIQNGYQLSEILDLLPGDDRYSFAGSNEGKIQDVDSLVLVLKKLRAANRYSFAIHQAHLITGSDGLREVIRCIPPDQGHRDLFKEIFENRGVKLQNSSEHFPPIGEHEGELKFNAYEGKKRTLTTALNQYIARIERDCRVQENGNGDFAQGFKFFKGIQAANRKTNLALAKALLAQLPLALDRSVHTLFSEDKIAEAKKRVLANTPFFQRFATYITLGGVNSGELKAAITLGNAMPRYESAGPFARARSFSHPRLTATWNGQPMRDYY